jgi:hypothetical protein
MPTIKSDGKTTTFFVFNQIMTWFDIPSDIVTNHGSHFQNEMMKELGAKLWFKHGHSSPYYPQANGQVENKSLKTILQKMSVRVSRLGHHAISCTLGIPNLSQDFHGIFPFQISTWCGFNITH